MRNSESSVSKGGALSGKTRLVFLFTWFALGVLWMATGSSVAGSLDSLRPLIPGSVGDWRAAGEDRFYDQRTIFEYIDGAGEVYRAYNMGRCLSRSYVAPQGARIILDVFDMVSSENAYGVFTHDRDGEPLEIGQDGLYKSGWLRFWKHRFFVSIFDEAQTPASGEATMQLAREVSGIIREVGQEPWLVARMPSPGLDARSIRYLSDPVVLNSHFYLSDRNILRLGPGVEAVLGAYRREGQHATLLLVHYADEGEATAAQRDLMSHYLPDAGGEGTAQLEDRKWASAGLRGKLVAVVLEADGRELARNLLQEALRSAGGN